VFFCLFVLDKLLKLLFLKLLLTELKFHMLLDVGVIIEPVSVGHRSVIELIKIDVVCLTFFDFGKQSGLS